MLDSKNFRDEISSEETTLVEFSAEWCAPCHMMLPVLEELSKNYRVMKLDVDKDYGAVSTYGISAAPTFIFFKNGEMKKQLVGIQSKENLIKVFVEIGK